jgi:NAD-dependent dihydropyrimidine dehydrogenase PreA subunit
MWKPERCDLCGECLEACLYLGYDLKRAQKEMKSLIAGEHSAVLDNCITCCACNTYCYKGAKPFDLIVHRMEKRDLP